MSLRSSLYEGTVTHHRPDPAHHFARQVALPLLFLDELPALHDLHPLVDLDPARRGRRPAVMRLRREDFLPGPAPTLEEAVRQAVGDAGGAVRGPIAMLGHVRTWGWLFNPLALYYCFDPQGHTVEWTVLEVTNTPWHERTTYVVGPPGVHTFAKSLHVSPFLPAEGAYTLRYGAPGEHLRVDLAVNAWSTVGRTGAEATGAAEPTDGDRVEAAPDVAASLVLRRRPLDRSGVRSLLWSHAFMTTRVSIAIYTQAARLALRGAAFHRHPVSRRGAAEPEPEPVAAAKRHQSPAGVAR